MALSLLGLAGCGNVLTFNSVSSREELPKQASHIFIGVIEDQELLAWPWHRAIVPATEAGGYWRILRRRLKIETVVRGIETRPAIDFYEVYWTGAAVGQWNTNRTGKRALFLLRLENGRYRQVQDWYPSIFRISGGPYSRLPLDDSRPVWERVALLYWWIKPDQETPPLSIASDPGGALSLWRTVKLQRGLLLHPSLEIRAWACRGLLNRSLGQDECWDLFTDAERLQIKEQDAKLPPKSELAHRRNEWQMHSAALHWKWSKEREVRRVLTAINNRRLRIEFCRLYELEYPGDRDNACPADRPPPATIVTEAGDVPLVGSWPR